MNEHQEADSEQQGPRPWREAQEHVNVLEWRSNNRRNGRQANQGGRLGKRLTTGQGNVNIKQFYGITAGVFVLGLLIGVLAHKSSR